MKPLDIDKLIPREGSFQLKDIEEPFRTKPLTLSDEIFIKNELGGDLDKILKDPELTCRLVYRILSDDSKTLLKKRKVKFFDESGDSFEKELGGVMLLCCLVKGVNEKIAIQKAILCSFGIDEEMFKEMEELAEKKTLAQLNPSKKQTGKKSLTSLVQNTDGAQNTSSQEQDQKSGGDLSA